SALETQVKPDDPARHSHVVSFPRRNEAIRRKLVFRFSSRVVQTYRVARGVASPAWSRTRDKSSSRRRISVEKPVTDMAIESKLPVLVTPLPGPNAQKVIARDAQFVSPSYTRGYPMVAKSGRGAMVEDVD